MCFMDMTFCASKKHKPDCKRILTLELEKQAYAWWDKMFSGKGNEAPIAYAYFCGEPNDDQH